MFAEFYRGSDLVVYPLIGLFIFIAAWAVALLRLTGKRAARQLDEVSRLPLEDDSNCQTDRSHGQGASHV